jgi:hypothetical protein
MCGSIAPGDPEKNRRFLETAWKAIDGLKKIKKQAKLCLNL